MVFDASRAAYGTDCLRHLPQRSRYLGERSRVAAVARRLRLRNESMRHLLSIVVMAALLLGSVSAIAVTAQSTSLLDLLPATEDVGPAFAAIDSRNRTLAEQAAGFANPDEAAGLLAQWEWQENAFKVFQAPTEGPPATLDISLTRFASAKGATQAL